jgi:AcrR family transcriptional regulator
MKTSDDSIQKTKFKAGAELKARVVEAASRLFAEEGYQNVSIRRIAQAAGCSQMAMYRHFPDKASLITHLCVELYNDHTMRRNQKLGNLPTPEMRLVEAARQMIELAVKNPNHYRLAFLTPLPDANSAEIRTEIAKPAIEFFRKNLCEILPCGTASGVIEEKLRQSFACLHGLIMMLITYPKVYKITKVDAFHAFEKSLRQIIDDRGSSSGSHSVPSQACKTHVT